jgi:hypothetical protein
LKHDILEDNWYIYPRIDAQSLIANLYGPVNKKSFRKPDINLKDASDLLRLLFMWEKDFLDDPFDMHLANSFISELNLLNHRDGNKRHFFTVPALWNLELALILSHSIVPFSNWDIHDRLDKEDRGYIHPLKEKFLGFHQDLVGCFPMSLLNQRNNFSVDNNISLVLGALDSLYRALEIRYTLTYSSQSITISDLAFIARSASTKRILNELSPSYKGRTVLERSDTKASITRESAIAWLTSREKTTLGLQVISEHDEKHFFDRTKKGLNDLGVRRPHDEDDLDRQTIDKKA